MKSESMNKREYTAVILFILLSCGSFSQAGYDSTTISLGYPVYSQYLHNGLMINPAYAGSREALSAVVSYRMQWMGTDGSPRLQSISLHSPMKDDKVALGLKAQFMQFGVTKSTSIYAVYAYHIRLKNSKLSFGLKAGADISNTDYTGLLLVDNGDPAFTTSDKPYVLPNIGAGIYFFNKKYFAGLSVPSFLSYRKTDTGNTQAYHSFGQYDFIIFAGGLVNISQAFKFKPSVLIDYSFQRAKKLTQFDINGNFIINDLIWAGISWRTTEQVVVGLLQVEITPQLMVGLSYDYPAGRMSSYSVIGSSEFILRYEFGSKVSAANPRYF